MKKLRKSIALLVVCCMLGTMLAPQTADAASKKPTKMTLNVSKKTIDVGGTCKIQVKSVTPKKASKLVSYKTSDKKIATVSKSGVVSGKKEGTAKIIVTSKKNKKLKKTVKITVKRLRPYQLSLDTGKVDLYIGNTYQLKTTVKASSPITFYSSDSKVATVDQNGKITAVKDGNAIITVKTIKKGYTGKVLSKTCKVNVKHLHQYVVSKKEPATCTKTGYEEFVCSICRDVKKQELPKLEHEYVLKNTVPATCESDGYEEYECRVCKHHKEEILHATGHDLKEIERKETTCKESGYIKYKCKNCQIETSKTIPKLEHDFEHISTVTPTCEEDGYELYKCKNCQTEKRISIPKLGHDFSKKIEHKDSTCGTQGYDLYQCSRCQKTEKKLLSFTAHELEKASEDLEYVYYKCKNCGETVKEYNDKEYTIDLGNGKTTTIVGHYDLSMPKELLTLCNENRAIFTNTPLEMVKETSDFQKYANIRAMEVAYKYAHYRPNGENVLRSEDFKDIRAENIVNAKDAPTACKMFLESPEHHKTIINNGFQSIAISTFCKKHEDGTYSHSFVQLFSTNSLEDWEIYG